MGIFDSSKRMFAKVAAALLNTLLRGADYTRLTAGRALMGSRRRVLSPQEWIRRYVGVPTMLPEPRDGADVRVSTYGRMQRRRAIERSRKGPCYKKQLREFRLSRWAGVQSGYVVRDPNARVRITTIGMRDALTGLVS